MKNNKYHRCKYINMEVDKYQNVLRKNMAEGKNYNKVCSKYEVNQYINLLR